MLLGKRPRLPIKRTTSMTGMRVDVDLADAESEEPSQHDLHVKAVAVAESHAAVTQNTVISFSTLVSPRNLRLLHPPQAQDHFLRTCGLCKRRLTAGRDIYMYRGDTAFCSSECREKQIKQDERREEYGAAAGSKKKDERHASSSRNSQTVGAA